MKSTRQRVTLAVAATATLVVLAVALVTAAAFDSASTRRATTELAGTARPLLQSRAPTAPATRLTRERILCQRLKRQLTTSVRTALIREGRTLCGNTEGVVPERGAIVLDTDLLAGVDIRASRPDSGSTRVYVLAVEITDLDDAQLVLTSSPDSPRLRLGSRWLEGDASS